MSLLLVLGVLPIVVDARSGCCSHHGGVCGCGCCDGTSLSATCAPYYPECSRNVYTPTTNTNYNPPADNTYIPPVVNNSQDSNAGENNDSSGWWTLGILGLVGYGIYRYVKNKNNK